MSDMVLASAKGQIGVSLWFISGNPEIQQKLAAQAWQNKDSKSADCLTVVINSTLSVHGDVHCRSSSGKTGNFLCELADLGGPAKARGEVVGEARYIGRGGKM